MRLQQVNRPVLVAACRRIVAAVGFLAVLSFTTPKIDAAIQWDAEAGTQWWFNPVNWDRDSNNNTTLPPGNATTGATDTQINPGTSGLPGGEGVVYDPANDPGFPPPPSITFQLGFGPQIIRELYLSRQTTAAENLLTIKGDLQLTANMQLGRSSDTPGLIATGRVNQLSGNVIMNNDALDVGATDTSGNVDGENYGNGIYDYRGGILEVSLNGVEGIRLSSGSSTVGAGGIGRFIMHNPDTPGYVRTRDFNAADGAGNFLRLSDGVTTGVGISEFHFENGGTRPIQVARDLILNNGEVLDGPTAGAIRSPRLDLVLNEAPTVDIDGIPQDLGLFDVDFSSLGGTIMGSGTNGDFFSSVDGSTVYTQGATVSASYLGSTYNWTISYTGDITWTDPDLGIVGSISDTGGVDVVLKGLSSIIVPVGLPGDHNGDDVVDAADYALWRSDPSAYDGSQGYTDWVNNFGMMAPGAGAGPSLVVGAIPEPGTVLLALAGLLGIAVVRRKTAHREFA